MRSVTWLAGLMLVAAPLRAQPSTRMVEERGSTARVTLTQAMRVGSLDGPDAFGRIMDATLDRRGRLLVADDLNHRVAVFGPDGRPAGVLGRRGRGPGEMESPWVVATDARDSIFVWDMALARINVYGPDLAFRRGFATPPQWQINTIRFLPDGRLLVAAYGRNEPGTLHVLSRTGERVRTFGPRPSAEGLSGFEGSLLGGSVDVAGDVIVYSAKSPYEIWFFDLDGRVKKRCAGARGWTTQPDDVVRSAGAGRAMRWDRFVHSYNVVALGGGLFINQVFDPAGERTVLDLVTSDCRLLRRAATGARMTVTDGVGSRLVTVRNLEYPEVVVYERRVAR